MSEESERVYTINLGKVLLSQSQHRAVRAINMIREFARHHMKVEEIKIEEDLAQLIWARGVRRPPRKIRVRMNPTDDGHILVSAYDEDLESRLSADKQDSKELPEPAASPAAAEEPTAAAVEPKEAPPEPASPAAAEEPAAAATVEPKEAPPEPAGTESRDVADSADKPKNQDTSDQKS